MLIIVELIRVEVEHILLTSFLCITEKSYRKTYLAVSNLVWYKLDWDFTKSRISVRWKNSQCNYIST